MTALVCPMTRLTREQASANRCLVIAAKLVAEYGEKYLPVFEHVADTCAALKAKREKSDYMRERALEIALRHGHATSQAQPASSISRVEGAGARHRNSPFPASDPSMPSLPSAVLQARLIGPETHDADYRE